jgi:hypothetical protein
VGGTLSVGMFRLRLRVEAKQGVGVRLISKRKWYKYIWHIKKKDV